MSTPMGIAPNPGPAADTWARAQVRAEASQRSATSELMIYAFGDESYPDGTSGRGRVAAYLVIAAPQKSYRQAAAALRAAFKESGKNRQHAILKALSTIRASLVLGKAELPIHLDAVTVIEAPSIGRVSPRAALWSWVFGFTSAVAILTAIKSGIVFSCADFYYENNDLSDLHERDTHETMRRVAQRELPKYSSLRFGPNAPRPVLRRITPVPKWPKPYSPQHIQLGTSCAHELLTFALKSPAEVAGLIEVRDFSSTVAMLLADGELATEESRSITPNTADRAEG